MIPPYGGTLVDCVVDDAVWTDALGEATAATLELRREDLLNAVNLATGCYSPLAGFMREDDYREVVQRRKLRSGLDWTVPILLRADESVVKKLRVGDKVKLTDDSQRPAAVLEVESTFPIDQHEYCRSVFGTVSEDHPGVRRSLQMPSTCVGGPIRIPKATLAPRRHFATPASCRKALAASGAKTVTAFSTRNVCHLGHEYLHTLALEMTDALGINVITGAEVKGSFVSDVVFDTYEYLIENHYPAGKVFLHNLRLPPIYAGPLEAFLQATVLQNTGFTHFIVGRDHAGIGNYYGRYASQEIFDTQRDLAIEILRIPEPRYCTICRKITTERTCRHGGADVKFLNGRDVRKWLTDRQHGHLENIIREELQGLLARRSDRGQPLFHD